MVWCKSALVFVLFSVVIFAPCLEGRKLQMKEHGGMPSSRRSLQAALPLGALPRGRVPPSAPSKKGHAMVVDQKQLSMHYAELGRRLKFVPSPGAGHWFAFLVGLLHATMKVLYSLFFPCTLIFFFLVFCCCSSRDGIDEQMHRCIWPNFVFIPYHIC